MKIYAQDRQKIVEMPRELWVAQYGDKWGIIGTFYINPVLGIYDTEEMAQRIFGDIFTAYKRGDKTYTMI